MRFDFLDSVNVLPRPPPPSTAQLLFNIEAEKCVHFRYV